MSLVVAAGVEGEVSEELAGVSVQDTDVPVVDQDADGDVFVRAADADVVEPGVVADGDDAGVIAAVVADAPVAADGAGGSGFGAVFVSVSWGALAE